MQWVVNTELIRDDGTIEAVQLGSVERGPAKGPRMWA
jgi:hypothetical protein